jgi:hypothetical protein
MLLRPNAAMVSFAQSEDDVKFLASNCARDSHVSAIAALFALQCAAPSILAPLQQRDDFLLLLVSVMGLFLIFLCSRPCDAQVSATAALIFATASSSSNSFTLDFSCSRSSFAFFSPASAAESRYFMSFTTRATFFLPLDLLGMGLSLL